MPRTFEAGVGGRCGCSGLMKVSYRMRWSGGQDDSLLSQQHTIQCEMMRWMVKSLWCRVPSLPPEPSARQIAEHELRRHAVYRSSCRRCVTSKGRRVERTHTLPEREESCQKLARLLWSWRRRCVADLVCQTSDGTVQLDALVRQ